MRPLLLAPLFVALLGVAPAAAEEPAGSFAFAPVDGRHLKIDRRSGRVSICEEVAGDWRCRLVPDDREAYEGEIARLQARIAELERTVARLEAGAHWIGPEDEKTLDEFFDFADRAVRRFFDMVEDFKRDEPEAGRL